MGDKIELKGYEAGHIYATELQHGLMGYFPLIEKEIDEPVYCTDLEILKNILKTTRPRKFKVDKIACFIKRSVAVVIVNSEHRKLNIIEEIKDKKFEWALGLLSFNNPSDKQYLRDIETLCI